MRPHLIGLGKNDLMLLLDFVDRSLVSNSGEDVKELLAGLADQVPTSAVIAGMVPDGAGRDTLDNAVFVNHSYPEEWLAEYQKRDYFYCDPVKRERLSGTECQVWSNTFARAEMEAERCFILHAREYGIAEGVTVGVSKGNCGRISFFSFAGVELPVTPRHVIFLRFLAPYLHEAMGRLVPAMLPGHGGHPLSGREREVLSWAMIGKTNWEISMILNISERTVKFHVQNVMKKLQASTRAHAVAIALGLGLISF